MRAVDQNMAAYNRPLELVLKADFFIISRLLLSNTVSIINSENSGGPECFRFPLYNVAKNKVVSHVTVVIILILSHNWLSGRFFEKKIKTFHYQVTQIL